MRVDTQGRHHRTIAEVTSSAARWLSANRPSLPPLTRFRFTLRSVTALVVFCSLVGIAATAAVHAATPAATSGILCTSSGPNPNFSLTAESGMISMPDGNSIFTWSYATTGSSFQFPGPMLCVNQGDTVTITLHNSLPEATSIMFPGMENVQSNGSPAQPELNGSTITSMTTSAAANGGSVTYTFTASNPGTYLYESGTDTGKQVQMGLFGALIVETTNHTSTGASCAYDCAHSAFNPGNEYVMLLSDLDPALHQAVELGQAYDVTKLHPRYWLINGRAFPDTIAPNNAAWLPAQPYSSLVHIKVTDPAAGPTPAPALVRYLNAGELAFPFHPHGENGTVIARDASALVSSGGNDLSYETFAQTIGPGQTWDELYSYVNQEHFNPTTNPIPVTIPQNQNLTFKDNATYYSGSPYLGFQGPLPVGTTSYNECGEYYMVWHSHALYQVANYDTSFGGMLTLERIDPLSGQQAAGTTCTP